MLTLNCKGWVIFVPAFAQYALKAMYEKMAGAYSENSNREKSNSKYNERLCEMSN